MRFVVVIVVLVVFLRCVQAAPSAEDDFNAGEVAYHQGNYALAVERYEEAYRLSREPALLYNVAQAYRLAGDCEHALSSYRQFIAADPASERRRLADELIGELDPKCGRPTPSSPVAQPLKNNAARRLEIGGLATSGAGAALAITGLLYGRRASTLGDEVSAACSPSCDWSEQRSKEATGRRDATIGYTLDAIGVAAIVTGAVMYYIGSRESGVTLAPRMQDGGMSVTWSTHW